GDVLRRGEGDDALVALAGDRGDTVDLRHDGLALRLARLEDLLHARQTGRDVHAGDTAGVERPHRQLRARLTDGLRRDDADGDARLHELARGERAAVALLADASVRAARERRTDERLLDTGLDDLRRDRFRDGLIR